MNYSFLITLVICISIIYMGYGIGIVFDDTFQEQQKYQRECSTVTDKNFNEFCLNYDVSQRTTR